MPGRDDVRRLGEPRPRRLDSDHPPRPRRRHQLHRHRRRVCAGRVGGDRRQGSGRRQARRRVSRDQGPRSDGPEPQPLRQLSALDHPGGRKQPAAAADRLDRPLPDPPTGGDHRHRRDARRADRSGPRRQGPVSRLLDVPSQPDRRGPVGCTEARPRTLHLRAAAVLDPGQGNRAGRAADDAAVRHGRDPLEPTGGRLADGSLPGGPGAALPRRAPAGCRTGSTCRFPPTSASSRQPTPSPNWPRSPE